jgi:hypothetical protein
MKKKPSLFHSTALSGHLNPVAMPCTQNRSYTCLGYRYWYAYALPCAEGTSWIFDLRIQVERLTIGKSPGQTPFSCLEFVSAAAEFGFLYDGLNFSVGNARLD